MNEQAAGVAPVEYAVAVDRYLAEGELSAGSRRVYRISLQSWAWPLIGELPPDRSARRKASPPVVPLAVLDDADASRRLAIALAHRRDQAGPRTLNRELSALRSAVGWWQRRRWIDTDPTTALHTEVARPVPAAPLTDAQLASVLTAGASLREQVLWRLIADSGLQAEVILSLDASGVSLASRRARAGSHLVTWQPQAGEMLSWLLARRSGPVFLTGRRAPAGTTTADVCPLSGRGRLSYRRAAEIFTERTRALDPTGRGWMLHQLHRPAAGRPVLQA